MENFPIYDKFLIGKYNENINIIYNVFFSYLISIQDLI